MDDFNNMGGDLNVKADINVVDAPTAQNVVMDAPDPFAEPVAPVTEPGTVAFDLQADVFEADPVTEVLPPAETGIPAAEAVTEAVVEPAGFKVQSQEDYFANAFGYGANAQPGGDADATFGDANGSAAGNYNGGNAYGGTNNYGGSGNYGNSGNYNGTNNYGSANTYGGAGNYAGANAYGTGNYSGANTYGGANNYGNAPAGNYGNTNTYGNAAAYGAPGAYNAAGNGSYGYKAPSNSYGGYNAGYSSNQEYSGPDYYGSNVYANDAFASYYEDDMPERKSNGLAIGALVCGIVSLSLTCSGIGIVPGIIAIILGIRGAKECEKARMANIGMILGIVGSVVNLIRLAAFILQLTTSIMDYF